MMWKKIIFAASLAISSFIGNTALAGSPDMPMPQCLHCFRPFIGLGYTFKRMYFADSNDKAEFSGINFETGMKYGRYYGLALGIEHFFGKKDFNISGRHSQVSGVVDGINESYFEAQGYFPLFQDFDLAVGLGADWLWTSTISSDQAWRFGVGMDYRFMHNFGLQAWFHYMDTFSQTSLFKYWWSFSAGFFYMFS